MLILLTSIHSAASRAADLEKLLMPGPVSSAHAKIEGQCSSCHDRANRSRQTALCLDCHKETADDVRGKTGFHGRMSAAQSGQCQACHSEHRGRNADIVHLSPASFDHTLTDFALKGAHATAACESCHRPGAAFRKAPTTCRGCHLNDDSHRGSLGTDCGACHRSDSWHHVVFDHAKTDFPLKGHHLEVPCAGCHFDARYTTTPRECVACHMPDDAHRGSRGTQCRQCHTSASWGNATFDHARQTGFALLGRHARLACVDCHRGGKLEDPLPRDCLGCHRKDDRHTGRFGADCASCHTNESWRAPQFDHFARSQFALEGAHARIDCHACHTGNIKEQKLGADCLSCHRADDVHAGALASSCQQCHGNAHWNEDLEFDHDLTNFPLLGLHTAVTCGQCHATLGFKDTARDCKGCHADQDVHRGSLGGDCSACHSPNGWNLWEFDHAARTRFALTGAHARLQCADCHVKPASVVKLSADCHSCHAAEDVHAGQFGRQCQRCHNTIRFRDVRIQ